jgi:chromosome segregation ATPase
VNEEFNKYYLQAVKEIESKQSDLKFISEQLKALEVRLQYLSDRVKSFKNNLRILKRHSTIASMWAYKEAKAALAHAQIEVATVKNNVLHFESLRAKTQKAVDRLEQSLPFLKSKVIRIKDE